MLLHVTNAGQLPSYSLRGYSVRALYMETEDIPVERVELTLPELKPGATATLRFEFTKHAPEKIVFDVLRPNQYSASTLTWIR